MAVKVGVPRALLFHYYYPLWKSFLENLGAEVVVSPPTNKRIFDLGVKNAVDEACLPVKVFYGHVLALREKAELLFIPRLVSVEFKRYICPKVMGLPDMVRANLKSLPPLIDTTVNLSRKPRLLWEAVFRTGRVFTRSTAKIREAWEKACAYYQKCLRLMQAFSLSPEEAVEVLEGREVPLPEVARPRFRVALLGHNYDIYDPYVSMDLRKKLRRMGVEVLTADQVPEEVIDAEAAKLPKRLFWTLGKKLVGSTFYFLEQAEIDGLIHLASFGCGPDSLVGDLVERYAHRKGKIPFLYLTVDEHTGEAGILTRVEAFLDMLSWRRAG